ncbi:MAG: TOPRIM nucleotidyl transferase/hydrolase domain-containing protein, partial [Planctomycetaceae bacterium]
GETEEQAIPLFARMLWGLHPHELGISVISVDGKTAYTPFLRLAARFNIAWCILSDGKDADIASVNECLKKVGLDEYPKNNRVHRIPNNLDFEGYMTETAYIDAVRALILDCAIEEKGLNEQAQAAMKKELSSMTAEDLAKKMRGRKTFFGARLPGAFAKLDPENRIPRVVRELLDFVRPPVTEVAATPKEAGNDN